MSKKIALAVWVLALLLFMVLLFTLNQGMTVSFWITFTFILIAFCSTLFFQCGLVRGTQSPDDRFLQFPSALISGVYVAAQIPLDIDAGWFGWKRLYQESKQQAEKSSHVTLVRGERR